LGFFGFDASLVWDSVFCRLGKGICVAVEGCVYGEVSRTYDVCRG
jgi:hypothetical protein